MIPGSEMKFHVQCGSEGLEEVGYEFRAAIRIDVAWNTMLGEDWRMNSCASCGDVMVS